MIAFAPGKIISGHYRLERELGCGGMGSVWAALDESLGRRVAIKFMSPTLIGSGEARARFTREARAAAQINSPHVVQIHEAGVEVDTPFIVMELLQGEDLEARLTRTGRLSPAEIIPIVNQTAKALEIAHGAGIVHRDLKPGNIFLARHLDEEIVKILDFGIAKAPVDRAHSPVTQSGTVLGTAEYMSPEQARGLLTVDSRSDLWSLGIILYQALTGVVPFSGEALGDVLVKVCTAPVPPASEHMPSAPPGLDRFFERALARDPNERFSSARQMAAAFVRILSEDALAPTVRMDETPVPPTALSTPTPKTAKAETPFEAVREPETTKPNATRRGAFSPALFWMAGLGVLTLIGVAVIVPLVIDDKGHGTSLADAGTDALDASNDVVVSAYGEPPGEDEFTRETEVKVRGSSALKCDTRVVRDWLLVRCLGPGRAGAPHSIDVLRGGVHETRAFSDAGAIRLLTPFVPGTDLKASFTFENDKRVLHLQWPEGAARPEWLGEFESPAQP